MMLKRILLLIFQDVSTFKRFYSNILYTSLQLTIDAQIGNGVRGDIAIDDITFTPGQCTGVVPTVTTIPPVTIPTPTYGTLLQ